MCGTRNAVLVAWYAIHEAVCGEIVNELNSIGVVRALEANVDVADNEHGLIERCETSDDISEFSEEYRRHSRRAWSIDTSDDEGRRARNDTHA